MTTIDIVRALQHCADDSCSSCLECPLTAEKQCQTVMTKSAAEEIARLMTENAKLRKDLKDCRNELCLYCGKYRNAHLGACKGCRWKVG